MSTKRGARIARMTSPRATTPTGRPCDVTGMRMICSVSEGLHDRLDVLAGVDGGLESPIRAMAVGRRASYPALGPVGGDAMKFWLRACPKCSGDLELQLDITGAYVQCVQCGLELNPRQERLLRQLGRMPAGPPEAVAPVADGTLHHQVA